MQKQEEVAYKNFYQRITTIISTTIMVVGVLVICGWVLDVSILKSIHPEWVNMKLNAAICFVLSGFTLWLVRDKSDSENKTAHILVAIITFIGALTLVQYIFNFNSGIDEIFIEDKKIIGLIAIPGRMSLATALNFVLIGLAFMSMDKKSYEWVNQIAVIFIFLISLMCFFNYIFSVDMDYMISYYL